MSRVLIVVAGGSQHWANLHCHYLASQPPLGGHFHQINTLIMACPLMLKQRRSGIKMRFRRDVLIADIHSILPLMLGNGDLGGGGHQHTP
jgi:hypothetical protein